MNTNPFQKLADPQHFRKTRAENMQAARNVIAVLTDPHGFYRLPVAHERVKAAAAYWVERARRAHAIALGREPLIKNFHVITDTTHTAGDLYAK